MIHASEMLVTTYKTAWLNNLDHNLYIRYCEKLKSHILLHSFKYNFLVQYRLHQNHWNLYFMHKAFLYKAGKDRGQIIMNAFCH